MLPSPLKATILWTKAHSTEKTEEAHWNRRVDSPASPTPASKSIDPEVRLCVAALVDAIALAQPILQSRPTSNSTRRYNYDPRSEAELESRLAAKEYDVSVLSSAPPPISVLDDQFTDSDYFHLLRPSAFAEDDDW